MKNNIDISFCLPVYNVAPYLKWCLDSILRVKDVNYEIICVDDKSTDDSLAVLNEYAKLYPQIKVIAKEKNSGVSNTRNMCIDNAIGKYIWFVDPDDMIVADCAKILFQTAEREKVNWVVGNNINVSDSQKKVVDSYNGQIDSGYDIIENKGIVIDCLSKDENGNQCQGMCFGIINRSFLEEHNIRYKENISMGEDSVFSFELFLYLDKLIRFKRILYNRRIRPASACTAYNEKRNIRVYNSYYNLYKLYAEWLEAGHYNPDYMCNNRETVELRLDYTRENVARCLAMVRDKKFVKEQLRVLKKEGIYPYKIRKGSLNKSQGLIGLLIYLLPIKPVFWLVHFLYGLKKNK